MNTDKLTNEAVAVEEKFLQFDQVIIISFITICYALYIIVACYILFSYGLVIVLERFDTEFKFIG